MSMQTANAPAGGTVAKMSVPTVRAIVVGGMVGALFSPADIGLFALIVVGGDLRRRRAMDRSDHPLILDRRASP